MRTEAAVPAASDAPVERHVVGLSTGPLSYVRSGTGRPLLYLHPMGGLRWTRVQAALARSFTVYAPLAPGFDGTPRHPDVKTGEGLGRLIGEFAGKVIGEKCDVHGHSFGGWCAMWLAATCPDRVDHLVLEAPAGLRPADAPPPPADPAERRRALFLHPEKLADDPARVQFEAGNESNRAWYEVPGVTDAALAAKLPSIEAITLIVAGSNDRITPKEGMQLARRLLRRAYLVYVWDAAHGISVDQPERMTRLVESFLARSDAFLVNWGEG